MKYQVIEHALNYNTGLYEWVIEFSDDPEGHRVAAEHPDTIHEYFNGANKFYFGFPRDFIENDFSEKDALTYLRRKIEREGKPKGFIEA